MIDQARLQELAEDFGEDDLADLIDVFLAETWEAIDDLGNMISDAPGDALTDQFHFLKGCARNLGATDFADRCEQYEKARSPFGPAAYHALRQDFQAVCDYFAARGMRASA